MTITIGNGITLGNRIAIQFEVPSSGGGGGGGGGAVTYTESDSTFIGTTAPPWVVTTLFNSGALFAIRTGYSVSNEFLAAINALTAGSVIQLLDNSVGAVTVTLTSGFDGTYTSAGGEQYTATCTSTTTSLLYAITSMTINP